MVAYWLSGLCGKQGHLHCTLMAAHKSPWGAYKARHSSATAQSDETTCTVRHVMLPTLFCSCLPLKANPARRDVVPRHVKTQQPCAALLSYHFAMYTPPAQRAGGDKLVLRASSISCTDLRNITESSSSPAPQQQHRSKSRMYKASPRNPYMLKGPQRLCTYDG